VVQNQFLSHRLRLFALKSTLALDVDCLTRESCLHVGVIDLAIAHGHDIGKNLDVVSLGVETLLVSSIIRGQSMDGTVVRYKAGWGGVDDYSIAEYRVCPAIIRSEAVEQKRKPPASDG